MPIPLQKLISKPGLLLSLFVVFALAASIQPLLLGSKTFVDGGQPYTRYNNYRIFSQSFEHLQSGQDLYASYPEEHWDLFKYPPTFAAFFGLFAAMPDWMGLTLWNLFNALVLLGALYKLPGFDNRQKGWMALIVLIELMTSMQNAQSNGLMAGLIIGAFGALENKKYAWATGLIVFSAFIKLFGILAFVLFLFYPRKGKLVAFGLAWAALLMAIPLLMINASAYLLQLSSYLHLLLHDHDISYGYSVMGWLQAWFDFSPRKGLIVGIAALVFFLPFLKVKAHPNLRFRQLALASVLIWVVIFNHKAESPTYIIAMAGVAIWFMGSVKSRLNISLFLFALVFTSLSHTDLFPPSLRQNFVQAFILKAFPCILIWVKIVWEMAFFSGKPSRLAKGSALPE